MRSGQTALAFNFIPYPTPLFDASGNLIGAVNMLVDITERKRAEEVAQRLASIVESSDDAILSKDLNGIITSWNQGAERLFGYSADEMIGKSVTLLIPAERQDEEPKILGRIRRGERIEHYETVRLRKDGSLIDISLSVSPIKGAGGKVIGASKIARDITRAQAGAGPSGNVDPRTAPPHQEFVRRGAVGCLPKFRGQDRPSKTRRRP